MLRMRSMLRRPSVQAETTSTVPTSGPRVEVNRKGATAPSPATPVAAPRAMELDIPVFIEAASPILIDAQDADVALLAPTPAPISEAVSGHEDADFELEIFVEES